MITTRKIKLEDIEILLPYLQEMYLEHDTRENGLFNEGSFTNDQITTYLTSTVDKDNVTVLIAEIDGEIAGVIKCDIKETPSFYKERKVGYLDDLVVLPKFRKQGVGHRLINDGEEWFRSKGINLIESKIYEWNEPSANLSKKLGYKKTFSYYYKHI